MEQYKVTGMSCAACSQRVEKAVSAVPGVTRVAVSLLTNEMGVDGTAPAKDIIEAVKKAGYGAASYSADQEEMDTEEADELADKETPAIRKRLIWSLFFLLLLMYISMGYIMWSFPLPELIAHNPLIVGIIELLLSAVIIVINQKFFLSGVTSAMHGSPNMDTLVALGSGASFLYSVYVLLRMSENLYDGNIEAAGHGLHDLYFEAAAMILVLITVGKLLEAHSKGKTTSALKGLMKLAPETATLLIDGNEVVVNITKVAVGNRFVVKPGEAISVDGIIIEGSTSVDESALTGESIPVDKQAKSSVSAGTLNQTGYIICEATKVGRDTTLSQIIKLVKDAATTKAPIAKTADKISGIFVPVVIGIATITMLVWLAAGYSIGFALTKAVAVLVISCPCALGLATPVAIMVGNGIGARQGILFKNAAALEEAGRVNIVALDKTGTITKGKPEVTDIILPDGRSVDDTCDEAARELFGIAYSLEKRSEHPLAKAIVKYIKEAEELPIEKFDAVVGKGLTALSDNDRLFAGNYEFLKKTNITAAVKKAARELEASGKTVMYFARNEQFAGLIAVADVLREESPAAIAELKAMGIEVVMLTGDNERTAAAIGRAAGVDRVVAGVLPEEKEKEIAALKNKGRVLMVGDGINDAPALTRADVGIAIGAGTDIAIDAASVVLMTSSLERVPYAIKLSREVLRNIHENLFWAFIYNIIGIPLAAGVWFIPFGLSLNPMFGAAAMSLSSFCVVSNALRLKYKRIAGRKQNKNQINTEIIEQNNERGCIIMKKKMKITGMMCGHCEARVKKCLEAVEGVKEAVVSHEKGTAEVTLSGEVSNEVLIKAVTEQDYAVEEIADM